jgi:hypothetical protein
MAKIAQGSERLKAWTKDAEPFRRPSSLVLIRTDPSLFLKCFARTFLSRKCQVLLFRRELADYDGIKYELYNLHRTTADRRLLLRGSEAAVRCSQSDKLVRSLPMRTSRARSPRGAQVLWRQALLLARPANDPA